VLTRIEKCAEPLPCYATAEGVTLALNVSPTQGMMWPLLATEVNNYQRYSLKKLQVLYEPVAGSSINGQLVFGFQSLIENSSVASWSIGATGIANMPWHTTVNVGKSSVTEVPITNDVFSQGGQNLYLDTNLGQTGSSTLDNLHYLGQFAFTTYNCSVQSGNLPTTTGIFKFMYTFVLSGQRLPLTGAATTTFTVAAGGAITVTRQGSTYLRQSTDQTAIQIHSFQNVGFLVRMASGISTHLVLDGVDIAGDATVIDNGTTRKIYWYPATYRLPGRHTLTTSFPGACTVEIIEGLSTSF